MIVLSIIALTISALGLLGSTSLYAELRKKEVSIRKLLGAGRAQLVRLICWQITKPVFIAAIFALPLGIFISGQYLSLFAERVNYVGFISLVGMIFVLLISLMVIFTRVWQVASTKPITVLRND